MSVEAISAVLHNSQAKGTTKLVLIGIANHEGDGGSWPSIATLCKYANCSDTRVRSAIKWLVANNELEVERNRGGNSYTRTDRRPNLYRVLVPSYEGNRGSPRQEKRGQLSSERGQLFEATGSTPVHPNRPIEPSLLEPSIDNTFDLFWNTYPRRTAKQAARNAFKKAVKLVPASTIINAAGRFAQDPNREDEFTPHASTWLNQGRWDDDPLPTKGTKRTARLRALEDLTSSNLQDWGRHELPAN